ncbi:MAG: hypothetical protein CVV46_10660 [Spirochaetae bacterium HGW-Spirochaetae-2]|jgi:hypothetical protein|nr:MAG: hypothetical protein CVV46_10660 [Spirochaetae bacterium HGW-Spirochaetae-2]
MMPSEPNFDRWMDDFFRHLFSRRPVDATFAGLHAYNGQLSDVSREGQDDTLREINHLLETLTEFDTSRLDRFQRIDRDLAEGFLRMQRWERSSGYLYRTNPVTYTSEAAFALISLFLADTRPMVDKQADFDARLKALPVFLEQGRLQLERAPVAWTERAVRECTGALEFLRSGIAILSETEGLLVDTGDLASAIDAFEQFSHFLSEELVGKPGAPYQAGETVFRNILGWAHAIDSSFDVYAYAEHADAIVRACSEELEHQAYRFGADSAGAALAQLSDTHPGADTYLSSYGQLWEESRVLNEREQLVTWTDYPIEYTPIPTWARSAQPYLYYLFYRCPPRWNRPTTYRYQIPPLLDEWSADKREAFLRANNTFVIKTNHVLHHGGIGHHVQNGNAVLAKSRIAQVAANDGPARLTMLCGGTLCEGWACYISSVAGGLGFLNPLESYAEISSHRRMAARAVVDIKLHCGRFTLEDAAAYYREHAMMSPEAAHGEAVKNSLFPGGAMMYLYGVEEIEKLCDTVAERQGDAFSLKRFHDEFLSYGTVPVARIAREMVEMLDQS